MLDRLPIGIKVFIAPAIIIALMLCVMLVSELAVRRQQAAFLQVVGGSLTTSTATTRLLLAVADVQSEILQTVLVTSAARLFRNINSSIDYF